MLLAMNLIIVVGYDGRVFQRVYIWSLSNWERIENPYGKGGNGHIEYKVAADA